MRRSGERKREAKGAEDIPTAPAPAEFAAEVECPSPPRNRHNCQRRYSCRRWREIWRGGRVVALKNPRRSIHTLGSRSIASTPLARAAKSIQVVDSIQTISTAVRIRFE